MAVSSLASMARRPQILANSSSYWSYGTLAGSNLFLQAKARKAASKSPTGFRRFELVAATSWRRSRVRPFSQETGQAAGKLLRHPNHLPFEAFIIAVITDTISLSAISADLSH
jgi:hypothetical protein